MADGIKACAADDIEAEDVTRFDHDGRTFAIYRSPADEYFATDGLCTHEKVHLADGLVMEDTIECPKHNAAFNYKTGVVLRAPACINCGPTAQGSRTGRSSSKYDPSAIHPCWGQRT
jgi:3-phenylpropionate/trans-cinnamate dioxygenase ferredoxin subunit